MSQNIFMRYLPALIDLFIVLTTVFYKNPKIQDKNRVWTLIREFFILFIITMLCYSGHTGWAWVVLFIPLILGIMLLMGLTAWALSGGSEE
jgi:hypothetical protein